MCVQTACSGQTWSYHRPDKCSLGSLIKSQNKNIFYLGNRGFESPNGPKLEPGMIPGEVTLVWCTWARPYSSCSLLLILFILHLFHLHRPWSLKSKSVVNRRARLYRLLPIYYVYPSMFYHSFGVGLGSNINSNEGLRWRRTWRS